MKNYRETDPEFAERFEQFAFEEVVNEPGQQLDEVTRHMAILATLLGCQGTEAFRLELPCALDAGITPVMAKEIVYQAVDYLGIGRVLPFLDITNEVLLSRGVALPLEGQCTTTMENRPYQPLACRQLLRRLLYPHRADARSAGNDHLLLFGGAGRLRAPAHRSCQGQHESGQ